MWGKRTDKRTRDKIKVLKPNGRYKKTKTKSTAAEWVVSLAFFLSFASVVAVIWCQRTGPSVRVVGVVTVGRGARRGRVSTLPVAICLRSRKINSGDFSTSWQVRWYHVTHTVSVQINNQLVDFTDPQKTIQSFGKLQKQHEKTNNIDGEISDVKIWSKYDFQKMKIKRHRKRKVFLPAHPFDRRSVLHSQVEHQGTCQLSQRGRRTQTLKDKNMSNVLWSLNCH